jgi:hypothetical protein
MREQRMVEKQCHRDQSRLKRKIVCGSGLAPHPSVSLAVTAGGGINPGHPKYEMTPLTGLPVERQGSPLYL